MLRHFNNLFVHLFVSEPGYYEDGAFGIRIENVLLVKPVELEVKMLLVNKFTGIHSFYYDFSQFCQLII